jgi:hypothetical protein
MKAVAGIFTSRADAERAFERLRAIGIPSDHINVLMPGATERELEAVPTTEGEQPGMGKAIGAVVGGAVGGSVGLPLGAAMSLAVPGIGPVIASGLLAAALLGVGGAAIGGSLEDTLTEGLPKDELFLYEDALRHGRSVIVVLAENDDQAAAARRVMAEASAESIDAARERWWVGLRDAEQAEYPQGRDFGTEEIEYRRGFETALHRKARGRTLEETIAEFGRRHADVASSAAFRRGYERGQAYLRRRDSGASPSLRKTA